MPTTTSQFFIFRIERNHTYCTDNSCRACEAASTKISGQINKVYFSVSQTSNPLNLMSLMLCLANIHIRIIIRKPNEIYPILNVLSSLVDGHGIESYSSQKYLYCIRLQMCYTHRRRQHCCCKFSCSAILFY